MDDTWSVWNGPVTETTVRRRLPAKQRRETILAAAQDLFSQRGYEAVGMRDVAAVCDLSATGIYRHFANKEALLVGVFDRLSDRLSAAMREASRSDSPREELSSLIRFHVAMVVREPAMIPIYQHESASLAPQERDRFQNILRDYLARWTDCLIRLDPRLSPEVARTTAVAAFGTMNGVAFHKSSLPTRGLEKLVTELAWRVVGHSP
jgi:AcrR family transcriptional regulator